MHVLAVNGGTPVRTRPFPTWPIAGRREEEALRGVLESGVWGIGGANGPALEEAFAAFQDAKHGVAVVNGTVSLIVALLAAGIGRGDEVIVPPYTFIATATAVVAANAVPVFADVRADDLTLDPEAVAAAVTERTRGIIPVHMGGQPCDMDALGDLARKHDLIVIEDAAQAAGAKWRDRGVGAWGHMGSFSFQSSKNLCSGEGGLITANDDTLAALCRSYRNCGRREGGAWYEHAILGWNYRLSEFQAAVLLAQFARLEEQTNTRQANGRLLDSLLAAVPGVAPQAPDPRITRHGYHLYILRYDAQAFHGASVDRFIAALNAEGIPAFRGYNRPLYQEEAFQSLSQRCPVTCSEYGGAVDYQAVCCPVAEKAVNSTVMVPHQVLLGTEEDMHDIVAAIAKIGEHAATL